MLTTRTGRVVSAVIVLILAALLGWFVLSTNTAKSHYNVKLGLDLAGGTELTYNADTSKIVSNKAGALNSLRDVIERRVNLFGVAEPLVQLEYAGAVSGQSVDRLIVDLPGVTDVKAAVDAIGKTPVLSFELVATSTAPSPAFVDSSAGLAVGAASSSAPVIASTTAATPTLTPTGLTGAYVKTAQLQFGNGNSASSVAGSPVVVLNLNDQGAKLFEQITANNVGRQLAIVLDGQIISAPTIQQAIPGGSAQITGNFTPAQARALVQNLNFGALPVPITLESSNTVGPTLGGAAYHAGLYAAAIGFLLVALFMILWYRLPGVIAAVALTIYVFITISVIKFVPVTLTASGIAGFILSIGLAVDANVLIFERFKEELRDGRGAREAALIGFGRAWPAIRDGHLTMIISAVILFWLGTSLVQGFALVFGFGVIASLISAVFISRVFLMAILPEHLSSSWRFLVGSGFLPARKSVSDTTIS